MSLHAFHSTGMIVADSYDDLGIAPDRATVWVKDGEVLKQCIFNSWTKTWVHDRPNAHGCSDCTHTVQEVVKNCQIDRTVMELPEFKETVDDSR